MLCGDVFMFEQFDKSIYNELFTNGCSYNGVIMVKLSKNLQSR